MNLEILRQKIHAIEWTKHTLTKTHAFGAPNIDEALPNGGLQSGCIHEWTGPYRGPLTGVCASILGRMVKDGGRVLWCAKRIDLYPSGLLSHGLSYESVICAQTDSSKDILWAVEEGLSTPQLTAVVAEVDSLSLPVYRRLQLCAQKSGVTLFLLLPSHSSNSSLSTAVSRWLIEPMPSNNAPGLWKDNGLGAPRFAVTLLRYRGAATPQKWNLEWNAKTLSFNLLSEDSIPCAHSA